MSRVITSYHNSAKLTLQFLGIKLPQPKTHQRQYGMQKVQPQVASQTENKKKFLACANSV